MALEQARQMMTNLSIQHRAFVDGSPLQIAAQDGFESLEWLYTHINRNLLTASLSCLHRAALA